MQICFDSVYKLLFRDILMKGEAMGLEKVRRIDSTRIEIPVDYKQGMRVNGIIYVDEALEKDLDKTGATKAETVQSRHLVPVRKAVLPPVLPAIFAR